MEFEAVLLDLDGTLVDTGVLHRLALERAVNHPEFVADHRRTVDQLNDLPFKVDADRIQRWKWFHLRQLAQQISFSAGFAWQPAMDARRIIEICKRLTPDGQVGMVTSTPRAVAIALLEMVGVWPIQLISADDPPGFADKPAPDLYEAALLLAEANPKWTLAAENSERGIEAAAAAGIVTIAEVPEGPTQLLERLREWNTSAR